MEKEARIKKIIEVLEDLQKEGKIVDIKLCPQCMSAGLSIMDVVGMYSPLSPTKYVCKKCGWVGRVVIELTNRRIDELDEEMLEDIFAILSEDREETEEDKD